MLCLNCKWARPDIEVSDEDFARYKNMVKAAIKAGLHRAIPEPVKDKIAEEGLPFKTREEFVEHLKRTRDDVAGRYSHVIYCKKKLTIVVANPDKPTQDIRECEYYTPK